MLRIKLKKRDPPATDGSPGLACHTIENIPAFDHLVHLSDIHIRPMRRHDEFQAVFQQTIVQIRAIPRSVIVITGDLFDNKTTFHPETFKLARDFLKNLTAVAPVFLIAGNHDMYENNQNRLDAITPVVDDIPGLHYLKYSGLYYLTGPRPYCFVVSSLYDKQFIRKSEIEPRAGYKYIALYHGAISGTTTDIGYTVPENAESMTDDAVSGGGAGGGSTRYRSVADFTGFDAVLLGDIHKHQVRRVPDGGHMAYAGSLIQQNHGEPLAGHGILVWDAELNCRFETVPNPYGFIDIFCENGVWTNANLYFIPPRCYARFIIRNCTEEQLTVITALVRTRCETLVVEKRQCLNLTVKETEIPPTVQRIEDENTLITEMVGTTDTVLPAMLALHAQYQAELNLSVVHMNTAVWKPISLEFKNLFGYGGNTVNRIEFAPGVTCISAANARGKTSFVNILLYGIFGKTLLNPSGSCYTFDIVNTGCDAGYVKIHVNYGGEFYLIERKSVKLKKTSKTAGVTLARLNSYEFTCGFWRSNAAGEPVENLQDTRKKNTDTALTELFGDIQDFSLANLLNADSLDLLTMTPVEQIKVLKRLFRLEIYDQYRELNHTYLITIETEIARLMCEKQHHEATLINNLGETFIALEADYAECMAEIEAMTENLSSLQAEQAELQKLLDALRLKIVPETQPWPPCLLEDKVLKKEILRLRPDGSHGSPGASSKELRYQKLTLEKAGHARKLPELSAEALNQEAMALRLLALSLLPLPHVSNNLSLPQVNLLLARLKDKVQGLGTVCTDQPLQNLATLTAERDRLQEALQPLSSNPQAIQCKLEQLALDEEPEPELEIETTTALKTWQAENAAELATVRQHIHALEKTQVVLNARRSKKVVNQSREALEAQLVDVPFITVRDVKPMLALKRNIEKLTLQLNQGERGRLTELIEALKSDLVTPVVRQRLLAYLEEKYTGVYDTTMTATVNQVKAWEKEYQNYTLLAETNAAIEGNALIQADIAELDYEQADKEVKRWRTELDHLILYQGILSSKYDTVNRHAHIAELKREQAAHGANATICERVKTLKEAIAWYHAQALNQEIQKFETVRDNLRLTEIQEQLDLLAHAERDVQELHRINQQLVAAENYERYIHLCNERHRRDIQAHQANETAINRDIEAQQMALTAHQTQLNGYAAALALARYKKTEYETTQAKFVRVTEAIINAQKSLIPYERYAKIMSNRGIACRLLYLKIKAIEGYINRIIQSFTKYTVHILYDEAKQSINIVTENRSTAEHLSIQRLSGYEKLMLQVAFKRALNKFSYNSKSSIIIIDEALDCIDGENFQAKLPEVMAMIAQDYAIALAISQRDISHISDRAISIRVVNGQSLLA